MGAGSEFSDMELQTLENMEKEGIRDMQFKSDDNAGEFLASGNPAPRLSLVCYLGARGA